MSNYLEDLFINEAKPALRAKNCSGSGGSGVVLIRNQDKTITENGVYAADEGYDCFGNVTVEIATSGGQDLLDSMIDGSITEVNSSATKVVSHVFNECDALTTLNFPLATSIDPNAFDGCSALTTVNFPLVTDINDYAFRNCDALTAVNFPLVTNIKYNAFESCDALTTVDFPLVTDIKGYAFRGCSSLTSAIFRKTKKACTLSSTSAFTSTPIESGTGYIYVPAALIEDYKVATNWSTYAAQFRALEDYTVDGTTTGALDETKISA